MRFVCDTAPNGGLCLIAARNPVTHTEVQISPPLMWDTWEQLDVFLANFEVFCRVNYHFGRSDPTSVDVSGWPSEVPDVTTFRSEADNGVVVAV